MASRTTVQITMPQMGESVTEGTILEWTKQVGEEVEADEAIVEVSTDKVDTEVPAPADGILARILVDSDETVPVGTVLGEIETNGAGPSSNGGAPAADPGEISPGGDESTVEVAEHGAAAEEEYEAAAEAASDTRPGAESSSDGAGPGPSAPPAAGADLVDLVLPQMGESVTEGTVLEWHRAVGDRIEADEALVDVSTDKVDTEIPAPAAGTLAEILVEADETVSVGAVLCRIAVGAAAPEPAGPATPVEPPAPAAPTPAAESPAREGAPGEAGGNGTSNATPVAARMASAHGLDVSSLTGSGPRGRVTKDDVVAAVSGNGAPAEARTPAPPAPAVAAAPPASAPTPIRGPAATLARFMNESRSIPTATSFRTVKVEVLDERRRAFKAAGRRLSFTHLIAWAIVEAAREMPEMAQAYTEVEGKPHLIPPAGVNLGLAVDVERRNGTRSLVTPVLQGADALDFPAFVARYDELVTGARDNTLPPEAYAGANMTLTNPGGIGTVASVPRLMPGQGTIVATGAIGYPAGLDAVDPGRLADLGVAKVMTMTSTYDHRVIQGAQSGAFLKRIEELLGGADGFYEAIGSALGVTDGAPPAPGADGAAPTVSAAPDRPHGGAGAVTASEPALSQHAPAITGAPDDALLQAVQAVVSVVKAHRMHGHLAACLDPLGSEPPGDPALDPESVNLTEDLMRAIPASVLRVAVPGETFADALPHLRETYCGTIAYEIEHISDHQQRVWLRQAIESGHFRGPLPAEQRRRLLERLTEVEALESYLHKAFLGRKQFSIEGMDMLVPMLDESVEDAAATGGREVVVGMAHRGRLNVLAHTVGRPYESILVEFEGEKNLEASTAQPEGGTGDVKYHHGSSGTYRTRDGRAITVNLSPNPSHLEFVDPVVEGRARADQSSRTDRDLHHDPSKVLPVLIHGDAAFPGQGVVSETLNLQGIDGYETGGTLHIITNNQLGFTTSPDEARSTRYASDLAKGFDVPIIHVNADDAEACIWAVRLALAFRTTFGRDALVDLIGYRRFGHNETDEPAYTQPVLYETIKNHPPVRQSYAERLVAEGVVTSEEVEGMASAAHGRLSEAHAELKASLARTDDTGEHQFDRSPSPEVRSAVGPDTLRSLNEQLIKVPDGFNLHRKLKPQLERRRTAIEEGTIDWAQAEALAFASLLCQGVPVRLTGQDTERGTFSHRHMVLHDSKTGAQHTPMQRLASARAPMELHNSPLSEIACLGFEYGYSVQAPEALVIWEAQFGDFVNGAQVIVDQFIASGLAKWGQSTRLTLLLPHGYEGSGPEHSSGRLERFLQLSAEGNMRVANVTTPAQYFHLLRRQALIKKQRPLIVTTPKSLLRLPAAVSPLEDFTNGSFQYVIDEPALHAPREEITRLVLCSGKFYYDLVGHESRARAEHVAVARVEMLYPFVENEIRALVDSYPNLEEVVWAQEEPQNMGARVVMEPRLKWLLNRRVRFEYVGRPLRASPAEGYPAAHLQEQSRIIREAFAAPAEAAPAEAATVGDGARNLDTASTDPGNS